MGRRLLGKRIDKWNLHLDGVNHEFEVRMLDDDEFMLNSLGETFLRRQGDDLKKLKVEVRNAMTPIVGADWEEWLAVDLKSDLDADFREQDDQEIDFSLSLEVCRLMFGKTGEGEKVHKDKGERTATRRGWPSEYTGYHHGVSYIKATDENVAALADIVARLQTLGGRLNEFLGRDKIVESLAGLAARLLPAPEER